MIFFSTLWKKSFAADLKYFFSLALFFTQTVFAQNENNFSFRHLTSADGLTSNNTGKIIQDSRGFLWICSEDGLNMYDGQTITQYYLSDYIPAQANSNMVSSIAEDADKNILIAAKAGVIKFSWNTKQLSVIYKNSFTAFGNVYLDLFVDSKKNIWINERVRIKKFDAHFHLLHTWNLRDSTNSKNLNGPSVTFICGEDEHNNVWFTDSNSVFKIDAISGKIDSSFNQKLKAINPQYAKCLSMIFTPNAMWMIVNERTVLRFNSSFQLTNSYQLSKEIVPFYSGIVEQNGKVWIATRYNGVLVLDIYSDEMQHYGESNFLASDNIADITKDATGNIWISTFEGVNEWQANTSFFYQLVFKNQSNSVTQKYGVQKIFLKDDILYAFISDGVIQTKLSNNQSEYFFDTVQKPSNNIYYASAFPYGSKWILSRHHDVEFLEFKNHHLHFSSFISPHPAKLDTTSVFSFYEDRNKNIWMGLVNDAGIICWHTRNNSFDAYSQKDTGKNYCPLRHFSSAFEDDDNNIWMGYDKGGLAVFNTAQKRFIVLPAFEKNNVINVAVSGMVNDNHGNFWIATNTGLLRFTKNSFQRITRKNGLPSNNIQSVIADKQGNIWVGFEGALSQINIAANTITTYTTTDGLPDENLQNPYYDSTSQLMFFCTDRSVVYFNAQQIKKIIPLLKPVITSFEVMGKEEAFIPNEKLNIPYSQNYLSFSFSAPDFINASETEYACKLDGADKKWNYIGNHHSANYGQLQPGNYIFKVIARVKGGTWQQAATPVTISILTPFWRTAWFWIVCIVIVFSVVFAFIYLRLKNKLEKQILAQSIRDKIAGDLHDDIGSTLSSISILSELAKQRSSNVIPFLNRITENTFMIQENISDIVWAINPKNDRFGNIIQRMSQFAAEMLEAKNMEVKFSSDDSLAALSLSMEKRKNFYLLYKEAINNCAKYSVATSVLISIFNEDQHINLIITDNGNGFDTSKKYNGNGMETMKKRAAELNGNLEIHSERGKGTSIKLSFTMA